MIHDLESPSIMFVSTEYLSTEAEVVKSRHKSLS